MSAARATIVVGGAEAEPFLQNLVTCDVADLGDAMTFGALLTPQGKILFDFFVTRTADGFRLETLADARDELVRRLLFYRLRAPVTIEAGTEQVALGAEGHVDPRASALPRRSYGTVASADGYDAARAALGVAEAGSDFAYGDAFPHDAGMDWYERPGAGIAFTKGCFVGQEVVSRMKHRGTARRRPIVLEFEGNAATGDPVEADGREIGTLGTVANGRAIALVRIDRAQAADAVAIAGAPARWTPAPFAQGRTA